MKPRKEHQVKRFEDLLPKFEDGTPNFEAAEALFAQYIISAEQMFGKLPPQAIEIEEAVLGACLIDPTAYPKAKEVLSGFSNPFYREAHNAIWSAMRSLSAKNEPIDRLIVFEELGNLQKLNLFEEGARNRVHKFAHT
jgi:DnaB-like helicase N terminal domain